MESIVFSIFFESGIVVILFNVEIGFSIFVGSGVIVDSLIVDSFVFSIVVEADFTNL